jgi:hypothetical protein
MEAGMIALIDLLLRLQEDVPVSRGAPSEEQYQRAVVDAVADFGRRVGRKKFATLNIVSGAATYDLPADFLKMISVTRPVAYHHNDYSSVCSGVLNTVDGLIPLPRGGFREDYSIVNGQITFRPTPRYSMAREYSYKAGYALSDDGYLGAYDDMSEEEAAIILLLAKSKAKSIQAAVAKDGISYRQGDVSVDTTGQANELFSKADAFKKEYDAAVQNYIGIVAWAG